MTKLITFLIAIAIVLFIGYKYFELDKNAAFQKSLKAQDVVTAESVAEKAISAQVQSQVKKYFFDHNKYYVSKSNNICINMQSKFDTVQKYLNSPVECIANIHTFTARIKTIKDTYYCADQTGFYTTALNEKGYKGGVSCR